MTVVADRLRGFDALEGPGPADRCAPDDAVGHLPVRDLVTTDIDGYRAAAAGVQLDMVRNGGDERPSRMRAVRSDLGVSVSEARPGCSTVSHTQLDQDRIAMTYVLHAAPGTRWCGELDLASGTGVVHQPGAEHTARNVPGTMFAFAIFDLDAVVERSGILEIPLAPFIPGEVDVIDRGELAAAPILAHFARDALESVPVRQLDDLLTAAVLTLSDPDWCRRVPTGRAIDSRKVVGDCIELAMSIGREPSIADMCLVAHTGARRLRQAFHDACGESPKRFFRHWALSEAHDQLLAARAGDTTVTRVATDLGQSHLGRFSIQYRKLHGESPSETLNRTPAATRSGS